MVPGQLSERRALVTGAGQGIGQAIAVELARQGAIVAVHSASSPLEETLSLVAHEGVEGVAIQADLSDIDKCRRLVTEATQAIGGLDILVNSAGLTLEVPFEDTTPELFARLFDLNIRGYFFCAQQALPHLKASGHGAIINITSINARAPLPAKLPELRSRLIIHIRDHSPRSIRPAAFKQNPLGREVPLHRLVIIEMIARQIRKHRHIKRHAIHAFLRQSVR